VSDDIICSPPAHIGEKNEDILSINFTTSYTEEEEEEED